jgi:uncharacterized protein YdaT
MKHLDHRVRHKAIEIANALLKEGYEEGRAISVAIAAAKKWGENLPAAGRTSANGGLHVVPHARGWAVKRTNAERASFIFDNKAKAQEKALEMARHEHVDVVIHDEDGKVEQHLAPV